MPQAEADRSAAVPATGAGATRSAPKEGLVPAAFVLGWHVAEFTHLNPGDAGEKETLVYLLDQMANLATEDRAKMILGQIESGLELLQMDASLRATWAVGGNLTANGNPNLDQLALAHRSVLRALMALGADLGTAYLAGVGLGETIFVSYKISAGIDSDRYQAQDVDALFSEARTSRIVGQLRDLKTGFQSHAGEACAAGLRDWQLWISESLRGGNESSVNQALGQRLYYQGQLWFALLSGTKRSEDMIKIKDYATALGDVFGKYFGLIGTRVTVAGVLGLAAGFGVIALALIFFKNDVQQMWAGLVLVLGVFGTATAGLGAALKKAVDQAGQSIWESELTAAVGAATVKLPAGAPSQTVKALRQN